MSRPIEHDGVTWHRLSVTAAADGSLVVVAAAAVGATPVVVRWKQQDGEWSTEESHGNSDGWSEPAEFGGLVPIPRTPAFLLGPILDLDHYTKALDTAIPMLAIRHAPDVAQVLTELKAWLVAVYR